VSYPTENAKRNEMTTPLEKQIGFTSPVTDNFNAESGRKW
jgi:hypothetical protein